MKCKKQIFRKVHIARIQLFFISVSIKIIEIGICRNMFCDTLSLSKFINVMLFYHIYVIIKYFCNKRFVL